MIYYLKKFWRQNLLVLLIQVVMYGLISWQALVQIQLFQALIDWEFRRFLLVEALNVGIWLDVPRMFQKRMERLGEVCAQEQAAASGKLKELLGGFDVLCFFGRKDRFLQGIEQASDQIEAPKYRQTCIQRAVSAGLIGNIQTLLGIGTTVLVVALSLKGIIIQAALTGTGNLCGYVSSGIKEIAALRLTLASSKAYFDRITVHGGEDAPQPGTGAVPVRDAIAVEGVSFQYDKRPILQDLSLQFKKGGKYALTGPSGCGKSTLLKLLLGWLPDYGGAIRFDGKDAKDFTPEQLQQQMSYIEQNVFLFNSTIWDNITLGETFTNQQMEKALRDSALAGDLASMSDGLDTIVGEEGGNLSGGQKQRVAIARALIHDRSILLVDEGTSALDQKNADIVEKSLLANPELTLILVSHHLAPERKEQFTQVYDLQPAAPHLQSA